MSGEGQQQPLITREISNLHRQLERLGELHATLSVRLCPVLEPEEPMPETLPDKNRGSEEPCRLAADIANYADRIKEMGNATQELLNRLQI